MLPMREPGHDDALEVVDHVIEWLWIFRRNGRKRVAHGARLDLRHDRPLFHRLAVVGNPIDEAVAVSPELVGVQSGSCPKGWPPFLSDGTRPDKNYFVYARIRIR